MIRQMLKQLAEQRKEARRQRSFFNGRPATSGSQTNRRERRKRNRANQKTWQPGMPIKK